LAGSTTNYGATKPAVGEAYDINIPNNNNDIWDAAIFARTLQAHGQKINKKVVANGAALTTLAVVENIANFPFKGNRRYRIIWHAGMSLSAVSNYFDLAIHTCSTADAAGLITGLTTIISRTYTANNAGSGESFYVEAIYEPPSDTTLQVKFTVNRVVGSGTWTLQASATAPAWYYIEDIGDQF
jgi:hypothetical protein